jgi:type III secretion protein U
MSDQPDKSQRTEQPSAKKIRDAREKGNVPSGKQLPAALSLGFVLLWLLTTWKGSLDILKSLFNNYQDVYRFDLMSSLNILIQNSLQHLWMIIGPIVVLSCLGAVIGNLAIKGFNFSLSPFTPDLKKISPITGFKRFFKIEHIYSVISSIAFACIVVLCAYLLTRFLLQHQLLIAPFCGLPCLSLFSKYMLASYITSSILIALVFAIVDWAFHNRFYINNNMMTKEEVKKESKQQNGDPQIKGKRKQLAKELLFGEHHTSSKLKNLTPSFVLTDSEHQRAIAIYVALELESLPKVIKVADSQQLTQSIIENAHQNDIDVYEDTSSTNKLFPRIHKLGDIAFDDIGLIENVLSSYLKRKKNG